MKRFLSLVAVLVLLLSAVPTATVATTAAQELDGVEYILLRDGTVEITAYTGADTTWTVPATIDGRSVSALSGWALSSASNLEKVVFEKPLTLRAGSLASSTLREVVLPEGLKEIGADAFHTARKLETLVIPEGVEVIGASAFEDCTSLKSVSFPSTLTTIGSGAFYGCSALEIESLPSGITTISNGVFTGTALYNQAENWENGAVYVDGYLLAVDATIDEQTFSVKDGTKVIAGNAFWRCSFQTIEIPASVTVINDGVISGCALLERIEVDDNNPYYTDEDGVLYNKDKTRLCSYPPAKKEGALLIPDGVTAVAPNAVQGAENLITLVVPASVTSIGSGAFSRCNSLKSATVLGAVKEIPSYAFYFCRSLSVLYLSEGVEKIGYYAFYNCDLLSDISLPDSVVQIEHEAFFKTAYYADENNWENDVLYLGDHLICARTTLSGHCSVKDGTKAIADDAFVRCKSLVSVTIPNSVTHIGKEAFAYCSMLEVAVLPEKLTTLYTRTFAECKALRRVVFPKTLVSIEYCAFQLCRSLTELELPDTVQTIETYAFYDCSALESVTIPRATTMIGEAAFLECDALRDVYFGGTEAKWNKVAVEGYNEPLLQATLHFARGTTGDMNADESLDTMDALLLFSGINGVRKMSDAEWAVADTNGDSTVNMMDALLLFRLVSGG